MLVPYSHKPSRKPMRLRSDLERRGFLDAQASAEDISLLSHDRLMAYKVQP